MPEILLAEILAENVFWVVSFLKTVGDYCRKFLLTVLRLIKAYV